MTHPFAGRTFAAVLFDLDGTLVDSTASVRACWAQWQREFRVPDALMRERHGLPSSAIVRSLVQAGGLPAQRGDEAAARIEALEIAAAPTAGITMLPGAAAALAASEGRSAIVTSCSAPLAAARIEAAGLVAPAVLVTADRVRNGKPDPECFVLAAAELGVAAADCLVVEDAAAGLSAARAAGARTLGLLTTTPEEELIADVLVADLGEVALRRTDAGLRVTAAVS